jgi:hypothetical protein
MRRLRIWAWCRINRGLLRSSGYTDRLHNWCWRRHLAAWEHIKELER